MRDAGTIVSAGELRALFASREDVVLLDARPSRAGWDAGHLRGALWASLADDLSGAVEPGADPASGGRHPLPPFERWCRALGAWGIAPATPVVVYDDQSGANAAARAWWMLRSAGHEAVAVLDGGLQAALSAGLGATTEATVATRRLPYPSRGWTWPTVDIATVDARRTDPSWRVLDVRSRERFAGTAEPIDPVAGHISGAVNVPYAENLANGAFRPAGELRRTYEAALDGVGADRLIVHCGSGVTACHTLLALSVAGLPGASLYVGSWSEWCRSGRPRVP